MPLNLSCSTEQKWHVKLAPVDALGKPAPVDGVPVWSVKSGNGTVAADADGMGAFLLTPDTFDATAADTIFQVDADADLGSGVTDISDTITLTATPPQATSLGLAADPAPVAK